VEIIVPGRHIDTEVTRKASRARWGPLLEAGAMIYEFQPTMYHTKTMIIDELWVSVGSIAREAAGKGGGAASIAVVISDQAQRADAVLK
jgi:hypothetical protein